MNAFLATLTIAMVMDVETSAVSTIPSNVVYLGLVTYQA